MAKRWYYKDENGNKVPVPQYKINADDYYTKAMSDSRYYEKSATDTMLATKVDKTDITQSTGTSTTAVMSQKSITDAIQSVEKKAFTKNDFGGILDKIEVTEDHTVFKTPYTLIPNIDYKIVNNIGVATKFNGLTEDGLQVTLANISNGQSTVFQVESECKYISFYAEPGTKGKYFEIGEGVDYRKKILNSEIEINEHKTESDFNDLKQGIIGENLEKPIFVLKHIYEDGGIIDNHNKNIVFKYPMYAAKGSSFYVKTGYKMQYALYDKTTLSFIKRVTWLPANQIVQLDDDYFIRIELADILESELTDTSISENLQMTLYNDAEFIDAKIKNISTQRINISQFSKREGIIAYSKWNVSTSNLHIVIPVYPNQLYKIVAGEAKAGYCFLKDYQTPVNGETPNYAEGYTESVSVEPNTTAYVTAPKDAYCMIVAAEISGVNRLPAAIYSYGEIDAKIEDSISSLFSSSIELSSYTATNGIIANGVWSGTSSTLYQHIIIPVNGGNYIITANDNADTGYCLLKDYTTPVSGKVPYFAVGYTKDVKIIKGTSADVTIPKDAKYLYILCSIDGIDRKPSLLLRKGHINSIIDNEIDNIELEVEDSFYQLSQQGDNLISILGEESIVGKKITIAHPDNYTCWPFIGKLKDRLVCVYTNALEHEDANLGKIYSKVSANGIVWTPKKLIIDTPNVRDGITGKGNDTNGNLLIFNRVGYPSSTGTFYDVYRTTNGFIFEKVSSNIFGAGHVSDIITIPDVGLVAFFNTYGEARSWGKLVSTDDGLTWTPTTIESGLGATECPFEISAKYIGNGRVLAIGRYDAYTGTQALWQMQSSDYGNTWTRMATNLVFGGGNTPSLLYDESTNNLDLFVYQRSSGKLFHMQNSVESVWDNPTNWANGVVIGNGTIGQDAGNVNSVVFNGRKIVSYYSGSPTETGIYAVVVE